MKVAKRIRVNARIPDPDGKNRDEITQEFTVELNVEGDVTLGEVIEKVNQKMDEQVDRIFEKIKELGGRDYTEEKVNDDG